LSFATYELLLEKKVTSSQTLPNRALLASILASILAQENEGQQGPGESTLKHRKSLETNGLSILDQVAGKWDRRPNLLANETLCYRSSLYFRAVLAQRVWGCAQAWNRLKNLCGHCTGIAPRAGENGLRYYPQGSISKNHSLSLLRCSPRSSV